MLRREHLYRQRFVPGNTIEPYFKLRDFTLPDGPRLNESQPITYFYHALQTFIVRHRKLKARKTAANAYMTSNAMNLILRCLHLLYLELNTGKRRGIRNNHLSQQSGWSTSQKELFDYCLGLVHETIHATSEEKESAQVLFATFETTRIIVLNRCIINQAHPYDDLFSILTDFEAAWSHFETVVERANHTRVLAIQQTQLNAEQFLKIFVKVTVSSLRSNLFTREHIEECDPLFLLGLPRLVVVDILRNAPFDYEQSCWTIAFSMSLQQLQKSVQTLNDQDLAFLTRVLVYGKDQDIPGTLGWLYIQISRISDEFQQFNSTEIQSFMKCICKSEIIHY
jgi:hypothetical protein